MNLSRQQRIVYDYLKEHPCSTIREIRDATRVQKPCMRLAEMERLGVKVERHGRNKYREERYSVEPIRRTVMEPVFTDEGTVRLVAREVEV